jgi:hypothetical protein
MVPGNGAARAMVLPGQWCCRAMVPGNGASHFFGAWRLGSEHLPSAGAFGRRLPGRMSRFVNFPPPTKLETQFNAP